MSSSTGNRSDAPVKAVTIEMGPSLWSAKKLPKNPIAVNPYKHIGDAYDRRQDTADGWEIKDP